MINKALNLTESILNEVYLKKQSPIETAPKPYSDPSLGGKLTYKGAEAKGYKKQFIKGVGDATQGEKFTKHLRLKGKGSTTNMKWDNPNVTPKQAKDIKQFEVKNKPIKTEDKKTTFYGDKEKQAGKQSKIDSLINYIESLNSLNLSKGEFNRREVRAKKELQNLKKS